MQPILNELAVRKAQKPFVDAWITKLIDGDVAAGRSQSDFLDGDATESIRKTVPALNRAGFDVYQGGGNIFQVRYSVTGPVAIHIRPLAQRLVKPIFA